MRLQSFFGTLADSTPFTDEPLGVHWYNKDLYDNDYKVGSIYPSFGTWDAIPHWDEADQNFQTEEEARAWLVAMYKMGGANEPRQHR